ncbi:ATP-binding protein [Paracoccus sp. (in: a-proteobacteria)]|uniref:ATP-binding protein n=1 Tax=Paracoccus sp. TaxID=267 RepID=UPI002AFE532A|nr:ATP-binding protein [Paracoccus sp. (in: a-proteobacteria)]
MKYISPTRQIQIAAHVSKQFRKKILRRNLLHSEGARRPERSLDHIRPSERFVTRVTLWDGHNVEQAISIRRPVIVPSPLSIHENQAETLKFLKDLREGFAKSRQKGNNSFVDRRSATPVIKRYADFSQLSEISTAAALIVTAEYERVGRILSRVPPTVNLDLWNADVFTKLYDLGFFEVIGLAEDVRPKIYETNNQKSMRIISMTRGDRLAEVDESLTNLGSFLCADEAVFSKYVVEILTSISEALANVGHHAYPNDHHFEIEHIGKSWITASADRSNGMLTVAVYDQGVSIPVTYANLELMDKPRAFLRDLKEKVSSDGEANPYLHDGALISVAARFGRSQTAHDHRGRGLPQMRQLIDRIGNGEMMIYSRGGWCQCQDGDRVDYGNLPFSVGGTLIEWKIQVPMVEERNDDSNC